MARLVRTALLLLLFATVPVHAAWAQSDQDRATARNLAIDAQKALGAKDYEKAVDLFGRTRSANVYRFAKR